MNASPKPRDLGTSTLGEFICERRKERGYSLRQLAKKVRISANFLSQIERNKAYPSDAVQQRIAEGLEVEIQVLKHLDRRVRLEDLRRMIEKSPEFSSALHVLMDQVKSGRKSLKAIADELTSAASS